MFRIPFLFGLLLFLCDPTLVSARTSLKRFVLFLPIATVHHADEEPEKGDTKKDDGKTGDDVSGDNKSGEVDGSNGYFTVDELDQALTKEDSKAFENRLKAVKSVDWSKGMQTLSNAMQVRNRDIRTLATKKLEWLAKNHKDETVKTRAVEILAMANVDETRRNRPLAWPEALIRLLGSAAAIGVGCLLWWAAHLIEKRLTDNSNRSWSYLRKLCFCLSVSSFLGGLYGLIGISFFFVVQHLISDFS